MSLFPTDDPTWAAGATFSPCRRWRWALWRRWDPARPMVAFLGLNPSTADERLDDPTIRRCRGFAKDWGAGSFAMLNLYGWRSTDPDPMFRMIDDPAAEDPVGLDNDAQIRWWGSQAERVIAAWGAFPQALDRGLKVVADLEAQGTRVEVLEWLAHRNPRHPLYARKDLVPQPWSTR